MLKRHKTSKITAIAVFFKVKVNMDAQWIGKMVRFHRKQAGITQAELGKIAGLGKTVIFDIEKGKISIRLDTLLKVFKILNIQIDFQSPLMNLFKETELEKSKSVSG